MKEDKNEFNVYPKRDISIVRGKGALVWDDEGREYIDCVAGQGVATLGHCNPKVVEALKEQSEKIITCPGIFYNDTRTKLLEKLVSISPKNLKKAFLCNSGTEAVEAALKFSRFTTKKTEFICAMRSFHGRTLGALSATFKPEYKKPFEPLVPGFNFVPFNNFEKLKEKVNDKTAAILLEVVQGEGGVRIGQKEYFKNVRALCDEKDILLIIDEIQTGFCRTGKMFACEHFDLEPDIMCLAKAIAGGVPMGAVLCSDKIKIDIGKHGTTFGGNPLACAAAIGAIEYMQENKLHEQAADKGEYFLELFQKHNLPKVREVRQIGMMIGIELKERSTPHIVNLMEKGILVLPAGPTVIRLLPPVVISKEQIEKVVENLLHELS